MPLLSAITWAVALALELFVLVLALRRKLFSVLPFFFSYLTVVVFDEFALFAVYRIFGFLSLAAFYAYWGMQGICISLRGLAVYEICRVVLSPYTGVWRMVRPILALIASALIFAAFVAAWGDTYRLSSAVLAGERGLELAVAGILLAGLFFCRHYGIKIHGYLAWIALGLGFYSLVQVGDNTFLEQWLNGFALWADLRHFSFDIALAFWGIALWKPLPAVRPAPALLSHEEYEELAPQVTVKLRQLNTRLLEMWK